MEQINWKEKFSKFCALGSGYVVGEPQEIILNRWAEKSKPNDVADFIENLLSSQLSELEKGLLESASIVLWDMPDRYAQLESHFKALINEARKK